MSGTTSIIGEKIIAPVLGPFQHSNLAGAIVWDELMRLKEGKQLQELQLLNYYKEVPILTTGKNVRFSENCLFCSTSEAQARIIEFTEHTVIKSKHLLHHIHASAHYNADTREVRLSDFSYVDVLPECRQSIRVRMHLPSVVLIETGPKQFKGRLIDLSLDGCAIDIGSSELEDSKVYAYLNIEAPLKENQERIKGRVMARFLKAEQRNSKLSRCVFLFLHDKASENIIAKLIALRQGEIMRELCNAT